MARVSDEPGANETRRRVGATTVIDAADELANVYAEYCRYTPDALGLALQPLLAGLGNDEDRGVDIGAGTGTAALQLHSLRHGLRLTALDVSRKMIARSQASGAYDRCIRADVASIPLPADSFDFAVTIEAFHLFPSPREAWREISRVVRRGGLVEVVTTTRADLRVQLFHQAMPRFHAFDAARHFEEGEIADWACSEGVELTASIRVPYEITFSSPAELLRLVRTKPFFALQQISAADFVADFAELAQTLRELPSGPVTSGGQITAMLFRIGSG